MKAALRVALGLLVLAFSSGNAATIAVPDDQETIQGAIDIASNFDTILVSPGTYTENINFVGKAVVLLSTGGRDVTFIEPQYPDMNIVSFVSYEDTTSVIDGFTVRNTSNAYGIACWRSHPIIRNCDISYCNRIGDGAGIICDQSAAKIRRNRIHNNHCTLTGGGILATWTHANTLEISNNEIYYNSAANGPGIGCGATSRRISITRNVIWGNYGTGELAGAIYTSGQDTKIVNNTIVANSKGIMIYLGYNLDIRNNIVVSNVGEGIEPGSATCDYNDVWNNGSSNNPGPHGISADPMFVDSLNHIYLLQSESPCIDAGDPNPQYNEPDGTRNDIGAYPFVAGGPLPVNINYGPNAVGNIIYSGTPVVCWTYFDAMPTVQAGYEIEVGTDTLWDIAEMWATGQVSSADTSVAYGGFPLSNHHTYYLRLRVHNGDHWGDWTPGSFLIHWSSVVEVPYDFPTIQAAIDAAIDGDTVLVGDGHYFERIILPNRRLLITSTVAFDHDAWHILNTIINGDSMVLGPADSGSVVSVFSQSPPVSTVELRGFTLRSGKTQNAIGVYSSHCNIIVNRCIITDNDGVSYLGGGLLTFDSCEIGDNLGSILSTEQAEGYELRDCRISGVNIETPSPCLIRDSEIHDCGIRWWYDKPGRSIISSELSACSLHLAWDGSCTIDSARLPGTNLDFQDSYAEINRSLIRGNAVLRGTVGPTLVIDNSTFIGAFDIRSGCELAVSNTIVCPEGTPAVSSSSPAAVISISCSDIYGFDGPWIAGDFGQLDTSGVFFLNPYFCDSASGDYTLYDISPCLPENNACGVLIGCCDLGCEVGEPYAHDINFGNESPYNIVSNVPTIYWSYEGGLFAVQHRFEIAVGTDPDWSYAEMWNPSPYTSPDTSIVYAGAPLIDGAIYWLRLRVHNSMVWSDWSQLAFRMNTAPTTPVLHSPVGDELVRTATPDLAVVNSFDPEGDSLYYIFEVSPDSFATFVCSLTVREGEGTYTVVTVDPPLEEDRRYWWRATASDWHEESFRSQPTTFNVDAENSLPSAFSLIFPPDTANSPVETLAPTFEWSPSSDSDPHDSVVYTLLLSIDSAFTFVNTISGIYEPSYTYSDRLKWGTRYWWKVKAGDQNGGEVWSNNVSAFRTVTLGDADGNGWVDIDDVVFIIAFIFMSSQPPSPLFAADANCNGVVDIDDVVYLIEYVFAGGPEPCPDFP